MQSRKSSTIELILTFGVIYLLTNLALSHFFPETFGGKIPPKVVILTSQSRSFRSGNDPIITIKNETDHDLVLPKRCPQPPINISRIEQRDGKEEVVDLMPNTSVLPCEELLLVKARTKESVNVGSWKYSLFEHPGQYQASLDLEPPFVGTGTTMASVRFSVVEPGMFTKLFRTFIARPLFNGLIFIGSLTPGHNLGVAIIILTIIIKLILIVPSKHALEGQKKLQLIQPKMDEIKKKYPNDPMKVQEETMKLWKEMKINPLQSCLPTLLQLPILIGLFLVIRDGIHLTTSKHLIYSFYQNLPSDFFSHTFLWFDLMKPDLYTFPILLVLLQFIQMRMMKIGRAHV